MNTTLCNPPRAAGPSPHLSAGRYLIPQRYIIGWPDGVIKVGSTWFGHRRWGLFTRHGGEVLDIAYYDEPGKDSQGEAWLQDQLKRSWRMAFRDKPESLDHLGPQGSGWLECYAIPKSDWPSVLKLAGVP